MADASDKNTSISNFYNGKSVLVTGGTGFIGKVLVEKLLYSCNDIDTIFLLIRGKGNVGGDERLKEMISTQVFERLRQSNPQILRKLFPIRGDLTQENLGANVEDKNKLIEEVSVVIHSAATINFNEKLDVSVKLNYEATKKVLNLCHRMKKLESFVYISTAYLNPQNAELKEVVYPAPVEPEELQKFLDHKGMDDEEKLAKFLGGRPNTYTFTKSLTESYVAKHHGSIPTAIIRPSIVTAAASEPVPGWIEGWSAGPALIVSTSLGYNRFLYGKAANVLDIIPVDHVINLIIAAAAANKEQSSLKVFNCCTSSCNPLSLYDLYKTNKQLSVANGHNVLPMPYLFITENRIIGRIVESLLEKLPSKLADTWRQIIGKKPIFVKLHTKIMEVRELTKPFTSRSFSMSARNTIALSRSLSEHDAKVFPFNPMNLNWTQYLPVNYRGIRKYLLKK